MSCSVVVDPTRVMADRNERFPQTRWVSEDEFWANELDPARPLPTRLEELVIYELHVGGLGKGRRAPDEPGTLDDAIELLPHLEALGVNAVELLPMNEFEGWASWGYGSSHFFAVEFSGGGRDELKHFVRACHRRGIAVILDVVYNHYHPSADRAQWMYDSDANAHNAYYWYEGEPGDYPAFESAAAAADPADPRRPASGHGGYVDNMSTGYAPRYSEELVRAMFASSAAALVTEFHVDGLRVDQTTSIHAYAVLHADGRPLRSANAFGAKFLRELTRTLRLLKPDVMLIAEDHSNDPFVTSSPDLGGLGFDAVWYADFYHHLIGDTDKGQDYAKLVKTSTLGGDIPLAMTTFSDVLVRAAERKVVYHESHDEAGNAHLTARTIHVASGGAPLVGVTRRYAEARCRVAAGLTFLSPGTPMFFMGEEIGAAKPYTYDRFLESRDDFAEERDGSGRYLFRFYQDAIRLRRRQEALRSRDVRVLHSHDGNRVLAFLRRAGGAELLVVASLSERPFLDGYSFAHPALPRRLWREIFNSNAAIYGGDDVGNLGGTVPGGAGSFACVVPANGLLVFQAS